MAWNAVFIDVMVIDEVEVFARAVYEVGKMLAVAC